MTVPGSIDRQMIADRLQELAALILQSDEPWQTASGTPLARPVTVEDFPVTITPQERWHAEYYRHTGEAEAAVPQPTTRRHGTDNSLLALREDLDAWLSTHRHELPVPLRGHTLEELAEVVLMVTCGQEIALLAERDPWRFEHSSDELRAAEEVCGWVIASVRQTVTRLVSRMSPENVVAVLLTAFVEGR